MKGYLDDILNLMEKKMIINFNGGYARLKKDKLVDLLIIFARNILNVN